MVRRPIGRLPRLGLRRTLDRFGAARDLGLLLRSLLLRGRLLGFVLPPLVVDEHRSHGEGRVELTAVHARTAAQLGVALFKSPQLFDDGPLPLGELGEVLGRGRFRPQRTSRDQRLQQGAGIDHLLHVGGLLGFGQRPSGLEDRLDVEGVLDR
jgi:hypothetical protein